MIRGHQRQIVGEGGGCNYPVRQIRNDIAGNPLDRQSNIAIDGKKLQIERRIVKGKNLVHSTAGKSRGKFAQASLRASSIICGDVNSAIGEQSKGTLSRF